MKSQLVDRVLIQNSVAVTSLTSLVEGYILNRHCENKSQATIETYQYRLRCFLWFCQVKGYPDEPQKITANHIRQFLWYLASEPNRWGSSSTSAQKAANQATVNHYYRVLHTFFNWLHQEGLAVDNPLSRMKSPKLEHRAVQALSAHEVQALLNRCSPKTSLDVRNQGIIMVMLDI